MRRVQAKQETGTQRWAKTRESIDEALVAILGVTVIGLLAAALTAAPA
ncbi:MAG: hypothetical protein P8M78_17160 [Myxococcota bacterium]|nr:hypothetical protein [Myxococcota bacterium]